MQEPIPQRTSRFYEFGPFRFYLTERELYQGTERVALPPKALDTLALLLSRHGHLVDKDELMKVVWPDTFVEESNLVFQISQLRKTLGEGPDGKPYIETVPRRGYRFAAVVTESWDEKPAERQPVVVGGDNKKGVLERTPVRERIAWLIASFCFAGMVASVIYFSDSPTGNVLPPFRRFTVQLPVPVQSRVYSGSIAISPNGRYIAYVEAILGKLWIHDLHLAASRAIGSVEQSRSPFWSPDSAFVGFVAGGELQRVSVDGGPPVRICSVPGDHFHGGTWSPDLNSIVFSAGVSWGPHHIYEVPVRGGAPTTLISPEEFEGWLEEPVQELHWPRFLPSKTGSRVLLFSVWLPPDSDSLFIQDLATGERELVGPGSRAFYSRSGHIVYQPSASTNELWALPFSVQSLSATGDAFLVSESGRDASVADDQTLVYLTPETGREQLVWLDRRGRVVGQVGPAEGGFRDPELSPDGRVVGASVRREAGQVNQDVWAYETTRGVGTLIRGSLGNDFGVLWSPNGEGVAYTSNRDSNRDIFLRRADGTGQEEALVATPSGESARDWSRDGNYLLFIRSDLKRDIWYLERREDGSGWEEKLFLQTADDESAPKLSPDGRYVAYVSDGSGRNEVYVLPFPDAESGRRVTVSSNGGEQPRWSEDGKELFYVSGDTLLAVPVTTAPNFSLGPVNPVFKHPSLGAPSSYPQYDVSADGQRFILAAPGSSGANVHETSIRIVQNWYEEFRDRAQN